MISFRKYFVALQFLLLLVVNSTSTAGVYVVTNVNNSGIGSLREAITLANTSSGEDSIIFQLPGINWNINLVSPLPNITDSIIISGFSQIGSSFPLNLVTINAAGIGLSHCLNLVSNNISILGLKFTYFSAGACIKSDLLGIGNSTKENLFIFGNVFKDSKFGINLTFCGFRNAIIANNKFWNNTNTDVNFTPVFFSRDVSISNNEFYGHNTSLFSVAIGLCESAYPYGKVTNLSVIGNDIRNCTAGIVVMGFTKIDTLNIVGNNVDALRSSGFGIIFGSGGNNTDSCLHVLVEGNVLDSCSGIGFHCFTSGDTMVYKDVIIKNNLVGHRLSIQMSGTSASHRALLSNFVIEDNVIPMGIYVFNGGTGFVNAGIDSLSIIGNTITKLNNDGINFSVSGTGAYWSSITNVLLRRNTISYGATNGIGISYSSIASARANISHFVIDSNVISYSNENGISIYAMGNLGGNRKVEDVLISDNEVKNSVGHGINLETFYPNPFRGIHILRNSIHSNGLMGIFESQTVIYANPKLPEPILDWMSPSIVLLFGHIQSKPLTLYSIQFYANYIPGNNNKGEGRIYFSTLLVNTDSTGYANFHMGIPNNLAGLYYSCTATDVILNSTSEFSNTIDSSIVQYVHNEERDLIYCFPSPADNNLYLRFEKPIQTAVVTLLDLSGRLVFRKELDFMEGLSNIEVSSIPDGCYLFHCKTSDKVYSSKVLINH